MSEEEEEVVVFIYVGPTEKKIKDTEIYPCIRKISIRKLYKYKNIEYEVRSKSSRTDFYESIEQ